MPDPLAGLEERLGHAFTDRALLEQALTHRSVGARNNERLEFLGDSIVNFVIAEAVYQRRPDSAEGDLSRLRATLVKGATLAEIGKSLSVGPLLRLGSGELKSGGRRRESIQADAMEALFGAVFLDAGMEAVKAVILDLYASRLEDLPAAESLKDPKTRLQEWLQGHGLGLPRYETVDASGADHQRHFKVACFIQDREEPFLGEGGSRRKAEQAAAAAAFDNLTSGH
ncbi:MAG: ribonuclease III [Gammaproteobacteria bacterium]